MGFFSFLGRCVGTAIEKVGNAIGSEFISNIGEKLHDFCSDRVAQESSYDRNTANINTTERISELLSGYRELYEEKANFVETKAQNLVKEYVDYLIEVIEKNSENNLSQTDIKSLKSASKRSFRTIKGSITSVIAKKLSLDDSECCSILKLDSGTQKGKEIKKFYKKVVGEALASLANDLRDELDEQVQNIVDHFDSSLEEKANSAQAFKVQLAKFAQDIASDVSEKEKNYVEPLLIIEASKDVLDILNR